MQGHFETLGKSLRLWVTPAHKFGTDAFLLSDFATPRAQAVACDLGAGCGIVGALWFRSPDAMPARVYAVELQMQAVQQMEHAIAEGGLPADRFFPVQCDLRDLKKLDAIMAPGSVDLVTCNPPYKKQGCGILSETDADQIARHETACTIEDICAAAVRLLRYGGRFCICHRPERLGDAICAMRRAGCEPKRLRLVQQRPNASPWLFLLEGRRGGSPGMTIQPPFIVEGEGGFSPEMLRIYQKHQNKEQGGGQ